MTIDTVTNALLLGLCVTGAISWLLAIWTMLPFVRDALNSRRHQREMRFLRKQNRRVMAEFAAKMEKARERAIHRYYQMTPEERQQNPALCEYMERSTWVRR